MNFWGRNSFLELYRTRSNNVVYYLLWLSLGISYFFGWFHEFVTCWVVYFLILNVILFTIYLPHDKKGISPFESILSLLTLIFGVSEMPTVLANSGVKESFPGISAWFTTVQWKAIISLTYLFLLHRFVIGPFNERYFKQVLTDPGNKENTYNLLIKKESLHDRINSFGASDVINLLGVIVKTILERTEQVLRVTFMYRTDYNQKSRDADELFSNAWGGVLTFIAYKNPAVKGEVGEMKDVRFRRDFSRVDVRIADSLGNWVEQPAENNPARYWYLGLLKISIGFWFFRYYINLGTTGIAIKIKYLVSRIKGLGR